MNLLLFNVLSQFLEKIDAERIKTFVMKETEQPQTEMTSQIAAFTGPVRQNEIPEEANPVKIDDHDYRNKDVIERNGFNYICGYLISKCRKKHSCEVCEVFANDKENLDPDNLYTSFRTYKPTEDNEYGGLCLPNSAFMAYISKLYDIFFNYLNEHMLDSNLLQTIIVMLKSVPCPQPCTNFPLSYLLALCARVRLYFTLKFVNRSFKTQETDKKIIILQHR
ncbi:uncharacterized protein LOC113464763 [Ceratina calcarata]|uniref:Uncharacterized protein LOC113464763 n=1 Tax=Ceratina calcarata TaxID=156304 RepID=A0AAJ7S7D4_9HYME|nr:uncharacterized protein LOC113464763 [Ceratina calcarata]